MNFKPSDQTFDGQIHSGGAADSLGEQLRRAREARGISLREISDQTRISLRHLEAIEADNYKLLPGGIFNRSFIKAYARQIKFDEEAALEAYARTAREHGEPLSNEVAAFPNRSRIYMDGETTRSPMLNIILSALMLGILVLGIYAALHWYRRTETANTREDAAAKADANVNQQAATPPPTTTAAAAFNVQIRARGEDVWLRPQLDEAVQPDFTLKADQTREFAPEKQLRLRYHSAKSDALEVTVNGREAKTTTEVKGSFAETIVTREEN